MGVFWPVQPSLAFGCTVSTVCATLLGFCSTYTSACLVRFLGGLLNGTLTITKSALAELCDGYVDKSLLGLKKLLSTLDFMIQQQPDDLQLRSTVDLTQCQT